VSEIPAPAEVVRSFNLQQMAVPILFCRQQEINQLRVEQNAKLGAEFFKPTIWDFAVQLLLKRARAKLTDAEIEQHCIRVALNLHQQTTPASREIARLDEMGVADELLAACWANYRPEAQEMKLPKPSRQKRQTAGREMPVATPVRAAIAESATKTARKPSRNQRRPIKRLVVNVSRLSVTLHYDDGNKETIDVKNQQAARWLKVLAKCPGGWISSSELLRYDAELDGVRTDRLRSRLPLKLRRLIETSTRSGSRLVLA
jgi:hypothetical protein